MPADRYASVVQVGNLAMRNRVIFRVVSNANANGGRMKTPGLGNQAVVDNVVLADAVVLSPRGAAANFDAACAGGNWVGPGLLKSPKIGRAHV